MKNKQIINDAKVILNTVQEKFPDDTYLIVKLLTATIIVFQEKIEQEKIEGKIKGSVIVNTLKYQLDHIPIEEILNEE